MERGSARVATCRFTSISFPYPYFIGIAGLVAVGTRGDKRGDYSILAMTDYEAGTFSVRYPQLVIPSSNLHAIHFSASFSERVRLFDHLQLA